MTPETASTSREQDSTLARRLFKLDRSIVTLCILVCLFPLYAWRVSPIKCSTIVSISISNAQLGNARLISYLQGRPMEGSEQALQALSSLKKSLLAEAEEADATGPSPGRLMAFLRSEHEKLLQVYRARYTDWKYFDPYAWYQVYPSFIGPALWAADRYGITGESMALVLLLARWAAELCLLLLAFRLTRSNLCAVACLAMVPILPNLAYYVDDITHANAAWQCDRDYTLAFPAILLGILLARSSTSQGPGAENRSFKIREAATDVVLILLLALLGLVDIYTHPNLHRMEPTVACLAVLAVGARRRSAQVLLRGAAGMVALWLILAPYNGYGRQVYSTETRLNHVGNQAFVPISMFWGLGEHPTHYLQCPSDYGFSFAGIYDPLMYENAPELNIHHSMYFWGKDFLIDEATRKPWLFPYMWAIRTFEQIFFFPSSASAFGQFDSPWGGVGYYLTVAAFFMAAFLFCTSLLGSGCEKIWPLTAILAWNLFAITVLFTAIHVHPAYMTGGINQMLCLFPALLFMTCVTLKRTVAKRDVILRTIRRPAFAAFIGLLLVCAVPATIEAAKEAHFFRCWWYIHVPYTGMEPVHKPSDIAAEIEAARAYPWNEPGTLDMHAAWCMFAWNERIDAYHNIANGQHKDYGWDWEQLRAEAKAKVIQYYRQALEQQRVEPYVGVYAERVGYPEWPRVFKQTLKDFPDTPYTMYMANNLSRNLPQEEARGYLRLYEDLEGQFLARTAWTRPGYARLPSFEWDPARAAIEQPDGLEVHLAPGEEVLLRKNPTFSSDRVSTLLYARVWRGTVKAELLTFPSNHRSPEQILTASQFERAYRNFSLQGSALCGQESVAVQLRAGPEGADLLIRDCYPLVFNPRFYKADGLLEMAPLREDCLQQWWNAPAK